MAQIYKLPLDQTHTGTAVQSNASVLEIWRGRFRGLIGGLLGKLGVPGLIKPVAIEDQVSGIKLSIHTGSLFSRISINGRDFYFNRLSGRFDGTGKSGKCD